MASDAQAVVVTLLSIVSYITARGGARIEELAREFSLDTDTVSEYVDLLYNTRRSEEYGDAVDVFLDGDHISLGNTEGVDVPIRLSALEAYLMLTALENVDLDSTSGDAYELVESVKRKLIDATGEPTVSTVVIESAGVDPTIKEAVRNAHRDGHAVTLTYYVASRDETTVRTVTPVDFHLDGQWYLNGYCHERAGMRAFRIDRITAIAPSDVPAHALESTHTPQEEGFECSVALAPDAAWLADDLNPTRVEHATHGPGTLTVWLRVYSPEWLIRFLMTHGRHVLATDPVTYAQLALERLE